MDESSQEQPSPLVYPRNRFISTRKLMTEENHYSSSNNHNSHNHPSAQDDDGTDYGITTTTYTSTKALQTSLVESMSPALTKARPPSPDTTMSQLEETLNSSTNTTQQPHRAGRGLIQLSVYDIPLVVFISCLLFLLISFVVQKHGPDGNENI